jgi:outer membrane protein
MDKKIVEAGRSNRYSKLTESKKLLRSSVWASMLLFLQPAYAENIPAYAENVSVHTENSFVNTGPLAVNARSLLELYKLALEYDPQFQGARHQHMASAQISNQSFAALLPSVKFNYQDAYANQDIISSDDGSYTLGKSNYRNKAYTLTLTQPLFNYSNFTRHRQAKIEVKESDAKLEMEKQSLVLRVAQIYMQALVAEDSLTYTKAEKAAVKSQLELARERLKIGLARKADLLDAKSRYANVDAAVIEEYDKLDDSMQAIQEIAGVTPQVSLARLRDDFKLVNPVPANVDTWIKAAIKQNPTIWMNNYEIEAAAEEVVRQRAGHYPTLNLIAKKSNSDSGGSLSSGGSEIENQDITLELNVPLYQGGFVSSRAKQAAELYKEAIQGREKQRGALKRETRAAYFGVISAIKRVKALGESVKAQRSVLQVKQEGFKAGLYTGMVVLDAERDYYMAKKDYTKARYVYILNTLRLKRAAGILSEVDLDKINQWLH